MDYASQLFIFLDVSIASVLTAFIGYERENEDKPAGIRTNIIIGGVKLFAYFVNQSDVGVLESS